MSKSSIGIGSADDSDVIEFLAAVTGVRRMISSQIVPVARKWKISERALGILFLANIGLDRPGLLIEFLNVLPSTITMDIEKLVEAKLVERKPLPTDRRATRLAVTRRGLKAQQEAFEQLRSYFQSQASRVSLEELRNCIDTLQKITADLEPAMPPVPAQP